MNIFRDGETASSFLFSGAAVASTVAPKLSVLQFCETKDLSPLSLIHTRAQVK
jgi:hypothetical protein